MNLLMVFASFCVFSAPSPPCVSYALVQATVGVGTVIIVYVISVPTHTHRCCFGALTTGSLIFVFTVFWCSSVIHTGLAPVVGTRLNTKVSQRALHVLLLAGSLSVGSAACLK